MSSYAIQKTVTKLACTRPGQKLIRDAGAAVAAVAVPVATEVGTIALGVAVVAAPYVAVAGTVYGAVKLVKWVRGD